MGVKVCETKTFATTRFFSSSYSQWESIYKCYSSLMEAFVKFRENQHDDCEETKYEVIRLETSTTDLYAIISLNYISTL